MFINLRYHVVSLVGVFLALLIGILVGIALTGSVKQMSGWIKRLENDLNKFRDENRRAYQTIEQLQNQLRQAQQFERLMIPSIIANQLTYRKIAIIQTISREQFLLAHKLAKTLNSAGAEVPSVTFISTQKLLNLDDKTKNLIIKRLGIQGTTNEEICTATAKFIAQELTRGELGNTLKFLQKLDLIDLSGNYNTQVGSVVIIGGAQTLGETSVKSIDLPLIETLKNAGLKLVGCEPQEVKNSYITYFRQHDISTIDNIDTPAGEVALVLVLAGQEGHFGVKPTADDLMPPL